MTAGCAPRYLVRVGVGVRDRVRDRVRVRVIALRGTIERETEQLREPRA